MELLKSISNISDGRYSVSNVFNDFLKIVVCCFSIGKMEAEYLKIIGKYNKDEILRFAECLAIMQQLYIKETEGGGWKDLIGAVFEEVNSESQASRSGQFFTPDHVCDLMAQMIYGDTESSEGEFQTVADPTCGSGRNLIAHCRLKPNHRFQYFYHASDLDERCVNMTVINYIMHGMKGVVINMNALSLEIFGGYRVYLPETGLFVIPLSIEECKKHIFKMKEAEEEKKIINHKSSHSIGGQILLF